MPNTSSMPYTRTQAIVSCCRIPGIFIHILALSLDVNNCSSPRAPVKRTIRAARIRISTIRYPGKKIARVPIIAVISPMITMNHERRKSPNGVFPIVMICIETRTTKSPYMLPSL